jgi:hypothetical protein
VAAGFRFCDWALESSRRSRRNRVSISSKRLNRFLPDWLLFDSWLMIFSPKSSLSCESMSPLSTNRFYRQTAVPAFGVSPENCIGPKRDSAMATDSQIDRQPQMTQMCRGLGTGNGELRTANRERLGRPTLTVNQPVRDRDRVRDRVRTKDEGNPEPGTPSRARDGHR